MMKNDYKIVDFDKYCDYCKFKNTTPTDDPCNECLSSPVNVNSRKPVNYVERIKRDK